MLVEKVKMGILDVCVCKNGYIKEKLSYKFFLKIGFNKPSFCQNIYNFWRQM